MKEIFWRCDEKIWSCEAVEWASAKSCLTGAGTGNTPCICSYSCRPSNTKSDPMVPLVPPCKAYRAWIFMFQDGRRPEEAAAPEGLPLAQRLKCLATTKTNGVPLWLLGGTTNEDSPQLKCLATTRRNGELHLHGPTLYTGLHSHG